MHLSWINIMADAAQLLAAGLVLFYCCLGAPPLRAAQVRWQRQAPAVPRQSWSRSAGLRRRGAGRQRL